MKRKVAEAWVEEITRLLTGKNLIMLSIRSQSFDVRQDITFKDAYIVEHLNHCVIGIGDSWGVMTGAERWGIDSNQRMIYAETTSGYGEPLRFAWIIMNQDDDGGIWQDLRKASDRLREEELFTNTPIDVDSG